MPFDAGTIVARLDLDQQGFDRQMKSAEARAKQFERDPVRLKIGQLFTQQDMSQARRMFTQLDQQISRDAVSRMRSSSGSVLGTLMSITSPGQIGGAPTAQQAAKQGLLGRIGNATGMGGGGGGGGGSGGIITRLLGGDRSAGGAATGLLGGIGPGILGLSAKTAGILGLGGAALGGLPALAGIGGAGALAGVGAGFISMGAQQLIGSKNVKGKPPTQGPLFQPAQQAMASLKDMLKSAAAPLEAPLRQAFGQIPRLVRAVGPALRQAFAGAGTLILPILHGLTDLAVMVLPLLGKAFRAAAPLIQPLIDGLGALIRGILPGLISLLHASAPAIAVFGVILREIGTGVGKMLSDFAPAIRASSIILGALGKVLAGLFPIIGKLASVFARALAPIFVQLAGVIRALMPILSIVGRVLASLAQAVLGDLVAAFTAFAHLLIGISPALRIVANALSSVFKVLENSGVFAVLGDALEAIVPILAKLINTLVKQLAPILPVLITLLVQFSNIMIQLLAAGLTTVLTGLLLLIKHFPWLVPLIGAATAAFLAFNLVLDANPIGLVIIAIVALIGAGTLLVRHWGQIWGAIKRYAADAWNFIYNGFGKYLLPLLGPAGLIALGAIELSKHWHGILNAIKGDADSMWQHLVGWGDDIKKLFVTTIPGWWDSFINISNRRLVQPLEGALGTLYHYVWSDFGAKILNYFTSTLPLGFQRAVQAISRAWNAIKNVVEAPVKFVIDNVVDGLISAFDWVSGRVGGPHIPQVHPFGLAAGGRIPGYGGGDRHPALLEGGEVVVPKDKASQLAWLWRMIGIPGYASGGSVPRTGNPHLPHGQANPGGGIGGLLHGIGHGILSGGKIMAALATGNTVALTNAFTGMFPGGVGGAVGDLATLLVDIPKTLVKNAIHSLIGTAQQAYGSKYTGHYGAGVAQWRGDVLRALSMEGLSAGLASRVLFQMQTESGGNPNAINLTDSNAAAGDPSRGLLQTIMSTFRAYHWPGTSWNIYNPLANIAAAINYALHRYGPSLMSGGMGMGSGHGYALGGPINEKIFGIGASGKRYTFGERGREWVSPGPQPPGDLSRLESLLERVIKAIDRSAASTGAAVGGALNGATRRAFYNSQYQTGGA